MKNFKNIIISFLLIVALILVSACKTKVEKTDYLTSWTDNATAKNELISYVKNVTDTKSLVTISINQWALWSSVMIGKGKMAILIKQRA